MPKKKYKKATSTVLLCKDNLVYCVVNLRTAALEQPMKQMNFIGDWNINLVCTLICQVVCRNGFCRWNGFVWGWFKQVHAISHSEAPMLHPWKGNHICRKSHLSAHSFLCVLVLHVKQLNVNSQKKGIKKTSSVPYYGRTSDSTGWETVVTHGYIQTVERESPFSQHVF